MIVINLFGGPGCGKSTLAATLAATLFAEMKQMGINCELVTEFAKDLTWEKSPTVFNQPYVFGLQYLRLKRLEGQVDYAITDSPLLLSNYYGADQPIEFRASVRAYHETFLNYNYFLSWPDRKYQQAGRRQSAAEAQKVHCDILGLIHRGNVPFTVIRNHIPILQEFGLCESQNTTE